jgi:hypothetical protein
MAQQGTKNHNAKLNEDQVREIRAKYVKGKRGAGYVTLAKQYKVSERAVRDILIGARWAHVK